MIIICGDNLTRWGLITFVPICGRVVRIDLPHDELFHSLLKSGGQRVGNRLFGGTSEKTPDEPTVSTTAWCEAQTIYLRSQMRDEVK